MFDEFRNRLQAQGTSEADAFVDGTKQLIVQNFKDSPMYMEVPVDGVTTGIRLHRGVDVDDPHDKRITVTPDTQISEGSYVVMNGKTWMVDKFDQHPYFPTGHITECGDSIRWKSQDGLTTFEYPCVTYPDSRATLFKEDKEMETATYQTKLYVKYNADTASIHEGLRVILGNKVYELVGIDTISKVYDGVGYIIFNPELTMSNPKDDWTNKIADNTAYYLTSSNESGGWKW